jgi:hypothetical protein
VTLVIVILVVWVIGPVLALAVYQSVRTAPSSETSEEAARRDQRSKITVAAMIAAVAAGSVVFRLLTRAELGQTAALFIGIPAMLAIVAVFSPTPQSAVGAACKTVTIGLLTSLVFLGEGIVCVLMSAPLFYLVAILIGKTIERARRENGRSSASWLALLVVVPMSLEGVTPLTTITRTEIVAETRVVQASVSEVTGALRAQPRFDRPLPRYLAIGFPRPTSTDIDGGRWVIRMRGGEMRLNGMEPRAGDLVLEKDGEGPGFISWRTVSDDSHMTHYLNWEASRVEWQAIDDQTTRVTWTLRYRRGLDPAWYFGPMERYAMHLAAGYLIDAVATP